MKKLQKNQLFNPAANSRGVSLIDLLELKALLQGRSKLANSRGVSLIDLLVSIGALGVIMMLFQTIAIMGKSFTKKTASRLELHQLTTHLKHHLCRGGSGIKMPGLDGFKTFALIRNSTTKDIKTPYEYKQINPSLTEKDSRDTKPVLTLSLSGMADETDLNDNAPNNHQGIVSNALDDDFSKNVADEKTGVKVKQDSHTFTAFDIAITNKKILEKESISGKTFASRCVRIGTSTHIYKSSGKPDSTIDRNSMNKSLIYILNNKIRPFYFTSADGTKTKTIIKCCDVSQSNNPIKSDGSYCKNENSYTPMLYVIYFSGKNIVGSSTTFNARVSSIQEYPSLMEMSSLFGSGFILTFNYSEADGDSQQQRQFTLDIMLRQNTCNTNLGHANTCRTISLNTDISTVEINSQQKLKDVIRYSTTSCKGMISTFDTAIIQL